MRTGTYLAPDNKKYDFTFDLEVWHGVFTLIIAIDIEAPS